MLPTGHLQIRYVFVLSTYRPISNKQAPSNHSWPSEDASTNQQQSAHHGHGDKSIRNYQVAAARVNPATHKLYRGRDARMHKAASKSLSACLVHNTEYDRNDLGMGRKWSQILVIEALSAKDTDAMEKGMDVSMPSRRLAKKTNNGLMNVKTAPNN
uniref:Uncharacterized protein n=1 Tax=Pristionchus pacificus TaxID=54126 RepID=A0A2A6CNN0_PRIPA|eukprot:PDM79739.1 hypothetical protein PRIPAC_32318 [Pristionchus pacificus]